MKESAVGTTVHEQKANSRGTLPRVHTYNSNKLQTHPFCSFREIYCFHGEI